ncbi:TonB family protein [Hymenobacter terricola]|uniref:TonB family protein n=1 Tax=Hymenobacter terricola TaxID=2819236 RepID=UPI001B307A75|nr:TonB family protein [Hymenobacter terricola]
MLFSSTLVLVSHLLAAAIAPAEPILASGPAMASHAALPAVAGRVITEAGEPLPGVFVAVQGTPQATSTNASGNFLLTLTNVKSVLLFKCQGYRDQMMPVATGNQMTVKMYALNRPAPSSLSTEPAEAAAARAAEPTSASPSAVLSFSEVLPTFPGGEAAYRKYIGQNAHFPEELLAKAVSGTVYVSFVVDEQGRITDAEVARGCGNAFDQEALRIIRLMPWWNPGTMAGKPVRVSRILPVPFVFRQRD